MNSSYTIHSNGKPGKKHPSEFIDYLKSTLELPSRTLKENQCPSQSVKQKDDKAADSRKEANLSKITEGDFSKIANSYILQGNVLRKQEAYEETMEKKKKAMAANMKQNTEKPLTSMNPLDRKQILKLQYLEKMGFLKPEEQKILESYRHQFEKKPKPNGEAKQNMRTKYHDAKQSVGIKQTSKNYKNYTQESEQYPIQPIYSPKYADQKKLNFFFSPHKQNGYGRGFEQGYGPLYHHKY